MVSNIKRIGVIGAALGLAALAIFMWSARGQTLASASAQSCAVYVAFYESMISKKAIFLNPHSFRFPKIVSPDAPPRTAPARFIGETGEVEQVALFMGDEPIERKIKKAFTTEVSEFFEPIWSGETANIKPCYETPALRPRFHKGRYKLLYVREKLLRRDDLGLVTIWRISPIGFSEDGKRALLYADYYCGGNCGGGSYYLFENTDGAWAQIGDHRVWIS